jgi:hypothetical protein
VVTEEHDMIPALSIDGNESILRDYTILGVTSYCNTLEKVVPIGELICQKPGENSANVCFLLQNMHEDLINSGTSCGLDAPLWISGM